MRVIAGGRNLTSMKVFADIDRSNDGIIRLTQLDYSIEEFEKVQNELSKKRKEMKDNLAHCRGLINAHKASGRGTQKVAKEVIIAMRPYEIKYENLQKEEKQLEKSLDKKRIKYREAYINKVNRTETQIKKCETEKEKLLKGNLEPKIYEIHRELEKTLDGLHLDLNEYNCKVHGSWWF